MPIILPDCTPEPHAIYCPPTSQLYWANLNRGQISAFAHGLLLEHQIEIIRILYQDEFASDELIRIILMLDLR